MSCFRQTLSSVTCLSALACALALVANSARAGEKVIFEDDQGQKVALPDSDSRKRMGQTEFNLLDRKSSVSGVGGIPEIPFTMRPRAKKSNSLSGDANANSGVFGITQGKGSDRIITAEQAAGVRPDTVSGFESRSSGISVFESDQSDANADSKKMISDRRKAALSSAFFPTAETFAVGTDFARTQLAPFGQFSFKRDNRSDNLQIETPDLFGGTLTASPFPGLNSAKTQKEKEKAQKAKDGFARLFQPESNEVPLELDLSNKEKTTLTSSESLSPFGADSSRTELTPRSPFSEIGLRGVSELQRRKEELLSPYQQANRNRGGLSFGTLDAAGSGFLNLSPAQSLAPSLQQPTPKPRPGVLEFPSRKF